MLKTSPSLPNYMKKALTALTLGIGWVTATGMPAKANPVVVVQQPTCSSVVMGSPIPAPVPMNTVTGEPCLFSSSSSFTTPVSRVILNSTLVNPTVINSRISDSVLINPVIINSPRYPYGTFGRSTVIYRSPGSVRIRISR